jgi:hypothetical protein
MPPAHNMNLEFNLQASSFNVKYMKQKVCFDLQILISLSTLHLKYNTYNTNNI